MVPRTVRGVGIAWYRAKDYSRILEIMIDVDKMHATYDQWCKAAELGELELKSKGHVVIPAIIDPEEFTVWCRERGLKLTADGRGRFSSSVAYRQVKDTH